MRISRIVTFTFRSPTRVAKKTEARPLAGWPFASGVPSVSRPELCVGGLHDGKASGEPCVLFGAAQGV